MMKRHTLTVAAVTLVSLTGCPMTQVNRLPGSSPLPRPAAISVAGDFRHTPSGYVFPVLVDAFQRVNLFRYDTAGLDVSAGYNSALPGCLIVLTIYVYPTPRMTFIGADPDAVRSLEARWLDGAYNEAKHEIARAHPDAALESEDARMQGGVPGKKAIYSIGDKQSELYLFVIGHAWFLEYRHSYPKECAPQARQAIEAFHKAWGGRV
jgi:hypothetical protein